MDYFTNIYEIKLDTSNVSFAHLRLNIDRTSEQEISKADLNAEGNLDITVSDLPNGYTTNVVRNADGTTYLDINYGAKSEEYNSESANLSSDYKKIKVGVRYKIIEDTTKASRGKANITASLETEIEGYTKTEDASGTTYTKQTYSNSEIDAQSKPLWSIVKGEEGNHYESWITSYDKTKPELQEQVDNNNLTVKFNTHITGDISISNELKENRLFIYSKNRSEGTNEGLDYRTSITYKINKERGYTDYLRPEEMTIKTIQIKTFHESVQKIEFYRYDDTVDVDKPFFTATALGQTFEAQENDNIGEYFAVITGYNDTTMAGTILSDWDTTWKIDVNKLSERMNIDWIKNIRTVTKKEYGMYRGYVGSAVQEIATVNIPWEEDSYVSYADISVDSTYNANTSELSEWKKDKNIVVKFNTFIENKTIQNVNPKLFIKLPKEFDYRKFKATLSDNANGKLAIKSCEYTTIENEKYLVIDMEGTYDSKYMGNITLTITHDRCLKVDTLESGFFIELYLLTDNEGYAGEALYNYNGFEKNKDGEIIKPSYVLKQTAHFSIGRTNVTQTKTVIYNKLNNECIPGLDKNGEYNVSSKEKPLIHKPEATVKYKSNISVSGKNIRNIDFIVRLPKENNTPITTNSYTLDSTISLELIKGIKITKPSRGSNLEIPQDSYTLSYSTQANVGYDDASSFVPIDDTTDWSTIKTLRVTFNDDYTLNSGNMIVVEYEMKMPATLGIAGASTAVRYAGTEQGAQVETLESTPAYVECGNPNGDIHLTKKFEGYKLGTAPNGVSLQGIQFKFINIQTDEVLILNGQTTAEGIVTTDAEGKIALTDVPEGIYKAVEISTFDEYKPGNNEDILISQGEVIPAILEFENANKTATLEVHKTWEDTNVQPGLEDEAVEFVITNTETNKKYYARLDKETNIAKFVGIPYGMYTIEETQGIYGWYLGNDSKSINISSQTVNAENDTIIYNAENKIAKGTIVIEKTVPEGDDVKDVTFQITSSSIKYTNTQGKEVSLNQNIKLNVGQYFNTQVEGISVVLNNETAGSDIAEGEGSGTTGEGTTTPVKSTKAIITLTNMPLGSYKIEEVDIPKIPETNTDWYVPVVRRFELNNNGETRTVSITNNWKTGTLKIVKTAAPGIDLSQFKVKVKLESSKYSTSYEQIFNIPETGILEIQDLYLGKYSVTEVDNDYYTPKYGAEKQDEPQIVTIQEGQTSNAYIYNENTYGYVKILKTLEGLTADNAIGITFKLQGKDATGANITSTDENGNTIDGQLIKITTTETINGKLYGVGMSKAIQAGGEYELIEMPETIPQGYEEMEPMVVDIKKENTATTPLELKIENKKLIGNLEISTKTNPEGGPLAPIRYALTEVKLNNNTGDTTTSYTYTKVGETKQLNAVAGFSKLNSIYSGWYIVEQLEVPTGYMKDDPILVEVPADGTAYAEFIIERPAELEKTMVNVEKEILTKAGTIATSEEIAKAQLKEDESFEVKLTNVDNKKVYYTFFSKSKPGAIRGLKPGTYEVEEIYKPKYLNTAYLLKENDQYTNINQDANNKYTITIPEVVGDTISEVTIKVQNTINTDFGFGGQDLKDNLSTITPEFINRTTRTIIYILDEDNQAVPGAQFKLYSANGKEVQLPFENNIYTATEEKKVIINGLPKGDYIIKNISVPTSTEQAPEGYVLANDKRITVYEGATLATRVELWKNKPRGTLKLSTTYTPDIALNNGSTTYSLENAEKTYVPRSKYKVLDPQTGKVLKFEKTATGDYRRSKLSTATDTIVLRAGEVTVEGIEVGDYQVGVVYLPEKYGVINTEPEFAEITANSVVEKEVVVKERSGFKKIVTEQSRGIHTYAITESGEIYAKYSLGGNRYEMRKASELSGELYETMAKIKAKDICMNQNTYSIAIVDYDGKIWTDCFGYEEGSVKGDLICISELPNHPFNNVKIEKVFIQETESSPCVYAIDEDGKVWAWGYPIISLDVSMTKVPLVKTPICISENTILKNVKITKVVQNYIGSGPHRENSHVFAIDDKGNLYYWGEDLKKSSGIMDKNLFDSVYYGTPEILNPVCITTSEGTNLKNIQIKDVAANYGASYFVDYNGDLWVCGTEKLGMGTSDYQTQAIENPIKLTEQEGNALYGKKIEKVSANDYNVFVIDSEGKIYGWGSQGSYCLFGKYSGSNETSPVCITDLESNKLETTNIKYIYAGRQNAFAIDENGELWNWGSEGLIVNHSNSNMALPEKVHTTQNAYFDLFEIESMRVSEVSSLILDKQGKLWLFGDTPVLDATNTPVEYFGTNLGAELEGIKVKDYGINATSIGSNSCNAFIIDTNNKLWTVGLINQPYLLSKQPNNGWGNTEKVPICLSDMEDSALYGKNIKYATFDNYFNNAMAVIDSEGKLYTASTNKWNSVTNVGYIPTYGNDDYASEFKCLNDEYQSILKDVEFEKVIINSNENMIAIDTQGNVWIWGKSSYCDHIVDTTLIGPEYIKYDNDNCIAPRKVALEEGIVAVDIAYYKNGGSEPGVIILDNTGKVHTIGTSGKCPLENIEKKLVKIGTTDYNFFGDTAYGMDEDGMIYTGSLTSVMLIGTVAKDFYVGPKAFVIKDINNEFTSYSADSRVIPSGKLGNIEPNELYKKPIDRIIDSETIAIRDGEQYKICSLSGTKIYRTATVNSISKVIKTKLCTIILDEYNHIIYKDNENRYVYSVDDVVYKSHIDKGDYVVIIAEDGKIYTTYQNRLLEITGFDSGIEILDIVHNENNTYIIATNGTVWRVSGRTATKVTGFNEDTVITNVIMGEVRTWAQEESGALWLITDTTASSISEYVGGKIKCEFRHLSNYSEMLDENGVVWIYDSKTVTKLIENMVEIKSNTVENYAASVGLTENGKLYTWGGEIIGSGSTRGVYRLGSTEKNNITPLEITSLIQGDVKSFEIYGNYSSTLKVVTELNGETKTYLCTANRSPWQTVNDEITSQPITPEGEYTQEDGYVRFANGDVGILYDEEYKIYKDIVTISIKDGVGLAIKTDGKLYRYNEGTETCISLIPSYSDDFARVFRLIKDSKYIYKN